MRSLLSSIALVSLAGLLAWSLPAKAQQHVQEPSRFEDAGTDTATAGAVALKSVFGGRYVYRAEPSPLVAVNTRLVLGQRQRAEFTLFSAEEEAALWRLQQTQLERLTVQAAARQATLAGHRTRRPTLTGIDWPRVTDDAITTCVPHLEYAGSPDWKQHLICWRKEDRHVQW